MVVSKVLCKSVALRGDMNLAQLLRQANIEISLNNPEALFVTAFAGILDLRSGALEYCNAGHEKPLLIAPRCNTKGLEGAGGPPIGVLDDFEYKTHQYRLAQEEFLCVFSDGITEAFNPSQELFGRERLISTLTEISHSAHAKDVMLSIGKSVHSFAAGAEPSDDLTVMVLRWKGIPI